MLLKGAALAILYYEDVGLRPMKDIDLLVPHDQARQSMLELRNLHWTPRHASPEALIPFEQATEFSDVNHQQLDLHWRLLWEGRQDLDDDEFWNARIPMDLNGIQTNSLCPADQLLHVSVHGAKWNETPSLRWIADAMMIIRCEKLTVDWIRLIRTTRERELTIPMRETLEYLRSLLSADIPSKVLTELKTTPTKKSERWFYNTRLGANDSLRMVPIAYHWMKSLRLDCEGNPFKRLLQFSDYLRSLWSIKSRWQIPFYLVGKPILRIYFTIRLALLKNALSSRKLKRALKPNH
jgi:hypothetical protein